MPSVNLWLLCTYQAENILPIMTNCSGCRYFLVVINFKFERNESKSHIKKLWMHFVKFLANFLQVLLLKTESVCHCAFKYFNTPRNRL